MEEDPKQGPDWGHILLVLIAFFIVIMQVLFSEPW